MDVDTPALADINSMVAKARDELAGVMSALTEVLAAVAVSDETLKHQRIRLTSEQSADATKVKVESNGPSAAPANPAQPPPPPPKPSIDPVLIKFQELRKSVENAVSMHSRFVSSAKQEEDSVPPDERTALNERRSALIADVRTKNEKVKLLIDQLRDLHRDIAMLLSGYYRPLSAQPR